LHYYAFIVAENYGCSIKTIAVIIAQVMEKSRKCPGKKINIPHLNCRF
jgi:hypothetical protein